MTADSAEAHQRSSPATNPLLAPWAERPSSTSAYLNLTRELAVTSFKLKYAGSILGYIWSLIKPLMVFGMMYVVFALFLLRGRTSAAENFPVELLVGIVVWTFFADATVTSLSSIVANGDMVRKAYFPRWILVAAATLSAAMTLLVNMALVIGVGLALNWFHFGLPTLIVIPILVELYVVSVGVGLLLAATFVFYRDLSHVWEIGLQFLFYASAIVFPLSLVPSRYLGLVALNPMAQMIEDLRRALVSPSIQWSASLLGGLLVVPIALSVICLLAGVLTFRRLSPRFGERV